MPTEEALLLKQLRNNVEFASVSQFLHTFQSALDPPRSAQRSSSQTGSRQVTPLIEEGPFDTEHFERMLLDDSERYRLEYLIIRLLKVLTRNRLVSAETWQLYLIREFYKRELETNNPFYQANYWPFPMSKTKITYEPVEPESKDDDDDSSVLSDEEKKDDDDDDENGDKRQDSKASDVKDNDNVKLEEQTPEIEGPMEEEQPDPINFFDLDLDTRVHVLHILCEWQLDEPERMREHLASEDDAAHWRVDPVGYDAQGNIYWLFDDNRLYRESQAPPKKSKAKGKGKRSAAKKKAPPPPPPPARRGTRRGLRSAPTEEPLEEEQAVEQPVEEEDEEWLPWKMLCLTSSDWQNFPRRFENSKHRDEQRFHQYLTRDLIPQIVPILEEREKEKKLEEALSNRKRSSRIQIRDLQQQERLRQEALEYAHRQQRRMTTRQEEVAKKKEDEEQASAVNSREERLKEREQRIQQREMEKIKALSRQEEKAARDAAREQERIQREQEKAEAKAKAKAAKATESAANPDQPPKQPKKRGPKGPRKKKVTEEEDNWLFDCLCGVKGQNLDDGTPMIACGRCGTWAHIACLAKHDPTRKSMKAWENVDYTCRHCIARAQQKQQQQPPTFQSHYTIDHEKERQAQNPHKRPWMDSPPHANPPFKFSRPEVNSYGPPQPAPPRMPVFSHQNYSSDGTAQPSRVDSGPRYQPAPYSYQNGGGQNGQHAFHSSGPSLPAPPPPVSQASMNSTHGSTHGSPHGSQHTSPHGPQHSPQQGPQQGPQHGPQHGSQYGPQHGPLSVPQPVPQHGLQHGSQHGPQHGYTLPHISTSTSSYSSSQLPPLQSHPPAPTNNQLPHLNPILPPANKLPFGSSSVANPLPRPQASNPLPSMPSTSPPTLPPMQQLPAVQQQQHHQSLPYPSPSTTSYPSQSQLPSLGPMPQQQSGQPQQR